MPSAKPRPEFTPARKTLDVAATSVATIIKPKEIIEMQEMAPLSLSSRRIANLLFKTIQDSGIEQEFFSIEKTRLRGVSYGISTNATERLAVSIKEIMAIVVDEQRYIEGTRRRKLSNLLAEVTDDDMDDDEGIFRFKITPTLKRILANSERWAKLESRVVYAFSSKYALALYELVALRINLKHQTREVFELEQFRGLLGVEKNKLRAIKNLKTWAIEAAVREVNGLCPTFNVAVNPIRTGRTITAVEVAWWPKKPAQAILAEREMEISKVGRQARLAGLVESIVEPPKIEARRGKALAKSKYSPHNTHLTGDDYEAAKALLRSLKIACDVYQIEADWKAQLEKDTIPVVNPRKNFLQFIREIPAAL